MWQFAAPRRAHRTKRSGSGNCSRKYWRFADEWVTQQLSQCDCDNREFRPCLTSHPCGTLIADFPCTWVSLAELATLSGVSRFQLLRGFAREIGITPHACLVQQRVRLARQHLANGQTPAQAALLAGFADQSHMTRACIRELGVKTSRYRAAIA